MQINDIIFKELVKRGYSINGKKKVWDLSDSKLWYLTPELSKGFLNLAKYEPYRKAVVEREIKLLQKNSEKIIAFFGEKKFNLIDLGCGGGAKAREFIKSLPRNVRLKYYPVDISSFFIKRTAKRIKSLRTKKIVAFKPFISDFRNLADIIPRVRSKEYAYNLILLLGETISHYDINDFLFDLSKDMRKNCVLVIGNGYRVGKRFVNIEKYKASIFNQWFIHIMKSLGFGEDEVAYNARFAHGRLEGYYTILKNKRIKNFGKTINFKEGDEVIVAIQYKFYERELRKFFKMYFSEVEFLLDGKGEYCLALCKK